jgi:hypothetical protein
MTQYTLHSRNSKPPGIDSELWQLSANVEAAIVSVGLELLGWLWSDPPELLPVAECEGINHHCFPDDLQLIYLALDLARDYDADGRHRLARRALQAHQHWDPTQIWQNYGQALWSDPSLAILNTYFPSKQAAETYAKKLIRLLVARRDAYELYDRAKQILAEAA